jgi:hypothetical protein
LSQQAVPVKFENRRLTVAVSGIRWKQQMQDFGAQMVFRLNGAFGVPVLNFIDFVVDETAVKHDIEKRNARDKRHGSIAEMPVPAELIGAAAAIRDPKLREDFLAAAGACMERPAKLSRG